MPIYEYLCNACNKPFEVLTFGTETVTCPECGSTNIDKQFSAFAIGASSSSIPECSSCSAAGCPTMPQCPGGSCQL